MAISSHNTTPLTPQTPPGEVLTSLIRRLRAHAKAIHNAEARRTAGKDMIAAADVIEQLLADMPVDVAAAVAMVALIGRRGYAAYTGGAQ
jgi:hypothetical protein